MCLLPQENQGTLSSSAHILRHSLMTVVRPASRKPGCYCWHSDWWLFSQEQVTSHPHVRVRPSKHTCFQLACKTEREQNGGHGGIGKGFMGVIMKSQWLGHWHWDIFSHPPPIIRWMEQEGVRAVLCGWGRMVCRRVRLQITFISPLSSFLSDSQTFCFQNVIISLCYWLEIKAPLWRRFKTWRWMCIISEGSHR